MPPVTASGIRTSTADLRITPIRSDAARAAKSHEIPPITAPMSGKKQMVYFMFSSFQSTLGIGMLE